MASNRPNTIYPCPFSKGYGIPIEQAWPLLKVFFIYRFIVASLFVILFYSKYDTSLFGNFNAYLYGLTSQIYFVVSILSGLCIFKRLTSYSSQAQIIIFTDIIFITLLMHASGGINSGIGIFLLVTIAAAGLLIGGRCGLLFAALASLSILTEQIYSYQINSFSKTSLPYAGMLGASFFTIAYLTNSLAKQSERLAFQHQQTISNLEELNKYIIQHLQSGIIISNSQQQIKMCNAAAISFSQNSGKQDQPLTLAEISPQLSDSFQLWLENRTRNLALIQLSNQGEIQSRFSEINTDQENYYMILLEDIAVYNQKIQQSKLASLGRLTASIAHEIRNPLGAISHAGQLLSEAENLTIEDKRLTEIIESHCQRVNTIIEDILQLSRRRASKKEKIQLKEWVEICLQNFIQDTECNPNCFQIVGKGKVLWAYIDEGHLKQIIYNLCSNALKYGDITKDKITIEISKLDDIPCIRIFDNGENIAPETSKHLFEPFFTTSPTGTGLGLYISKELAELNQAKLNYVITDDNKSCFKLSLSSTNNSIIEI